MGDPCGALHSSLVPLSLELYPYRTKTSLSLIKESTHSMKSRGHPCALSLQISLFYIIILKAPAMSRVSKEVTRPLAKAALIL
jgi:hypothetical protein